MDLSFPRCYLVCTRSRGCVFFLAQEMICILELLVQRKTCWCKIGIIMQTYIFLKIFCTCALQGSIATLTIT